MHKISNSLLPPLKDYFDNISKDFETIPFGRKRLLQELASYISGKISKQKSANLNFICTHNSRRSHMGQLWAASAAAYIGVQNVNCYSGGTEATDFNVRAIEVLRNSGFKIERQMDAPNPLYLVSYSVEDDQIKSFSKRYNDPFNPETDFAAVMTCSEADEACPVVIGADARFSVSYDDPKEADDTEYEAERYAERSRQIATEMLFLFSEVK